MPPEDGSPAGGPEERRPALPGQRSSHHPRGGDSDAAGLLPAGESADGPAVGADDGPDDGASVVPGHSPARSDAPAESAAGAAADPSPESGTPSPVGTPTGSAARPDGRQVAARRTGRPSAGRPDGQRPARSGASRTGPADAAAPGTAAAEAVHPARARRRLGGRVTGTPEDEPADAVLADRARAGDDAAFTVLYERHVDAVRRLARLCTRTPETAEDLAAETFTRTLQALRAGHGPREACRPYLLTTVRRVAGDWARNERRVLLTDDIAAYERGDGPDPDDPAVLAADRRLAARAFQDLPERWQAVLWYAEIEGEPNARIGSRLGVAPNAVAKLAERARDGLRDAYLAAYAAGDIPEECRPFAARFPKFVRGKLGERRAGAVRDHLDACARCRAACLELAEVSTSMRVVAEGLLGAAALGYVAAGSAAAAAGAAVAAGVAAGGSPGAPGGAAADAARAAARGRRAVRAGAGAATVVALAALAWALTSGGDSRPAKATPPPPPPPVAVSAPVVPPAPPAPPPPPLPPEPPEPQSPPPVRPAPAPAKAPPPPSRTPAPPSPRPIVRVLVEPTRIVVDDGRGARVRCARGAAHGRCDRLTITVPDRAGKGGRAAQPACRAVGGSRNGHGPQVTLCR